jgi:hypothetical protein
MSKRHPFTAIAEVYAAASRRAAGRRQQLDAATADGCVVARGRAGRGLLVIGLVAAGCASQGADTRDAGAAEFRGVYVSGFEVMSFQPCGSSERWWVARSGPLMQPYRDLATRDYEPVLAVVRGDTSALGRYGHMSSYDRELHISGVVTVERLPADDAAGARACGT